MVKSNFMFEEIDDDFRLEKVRAGSVPCNNCCSGVFSTQAADVKACCEEMVSGNIADPNS